MDEKVIKAVDMEDKNTAKDKVLPVTSVDKKVWPVTSMDKKVFPVTSMDKKALPVTSMDIKKKEEEEVARFPMLLSVQGVLKWAFLLACIMAAATALSYIPIPCSQSQSAWINQCPNLTPAQGVEVESLGQGFLWLTVPQAAAAGVGLLLPRRQARSRWYLAFLAIVSATVAHCMIGNMTLVFTAANPGDIGFKFLCGGSAVVYVAGDLFGLLSLVVRGRPE